MVTKERHVFIDLGAFNGDTVALALKHLPPIDEVYCFEPLAIHCETIRERFGSEGYHVINAVAGVTDGVTRIFMGGDYGDIAASTHEGNPNCTSESIVVPSIDFPRFFREIFPAEKPIPRITLKLNIEGSEYPILEQLLADGSISRVTTLYCDWHWSMVQISEEDHQSLVRRLRSCGFALGGGKSDELYNVCRTNPLLLSLQKWIEYHRRSTKIFLKLRLPGVYSSLKVFRAAFR